MRALWGVALASALVAAGVDTMRPTAADAAPAPIATAATSPHELGRAVYNFRCYFCHGYSGDARTLAATYLQPSPRDFSAATREQLPAERIADAVRHGRPGTAMKGFAGILSAAEIEAVSGFVASEFVEHKRPNTRYHTEANGWPDHERHAAAFPFARGELALDAAPETLTPIQQQGRQLFLSTCISCHDRARVIDEGPAWSARPVSYPRNGFVPPDPQGPALDAVSSASVYAQHEAAPRIADLSARERRGQILYQANCAFCHAGDGTGKNWIGQFMEPKARDLTQYTGQSMPPARLQQTIREGLAGTSMPAWKSVLPPRDIEAVGAYVARAFFKPPS